MPLKQEQSSGKWKKMEYENVIKILKNTVGLKVCSGLYSTIVDFE
jgi:hypothetical protein